MLETEKRIEAEKHLERVLKTNSGDFDMSDNQEFDCYCLYDSIQRTYAKDGKEATLKKYYTKNGEGMTFETWFL